MNHAEAGIEAYQEYLQHLHASGWVYFLEGGQAVNFWAESIDAWDHSKKLTSMRPFMSKDCDIWVSPDTWQRMKGDSNIRKGSSPADGQLGILTLSENPPRVVDMLSSVYGIPVKEYPRLEKRVLDDGMIRVIDPLHLFLSKCHCLIGLPQADRQDERHVRMLSLILPSYLMMLVEEVKEGRVTERALIKELKLLRKISNTSVCRRALERIGSPPPCLFPVSEMSGCGLSLVEQFVNSQFLQSGF